MSSVLHPVGPEPRERYWVRRVAVLVAAVVAIGVIIALVGNAMSAGSAVQAEPAVPSVPAPTVPQPVPASTSATPSASLTPGASTSGTPTPGTTPTSSASASTSPSPTKASGSASSADPSTAQKSDKKSDTSDKTDKKTDKSEKSTKKSTKKTEQPVPAACDVAQLRPTLTGDPRVKTGAKTTLSLSLINGGTKTCLAKVFAADVRLTVVSGSDRIWSTKDCPAAMPTTKRILLTQHALTWKVTWDGSRSGAGCSTSKEKPEKGYYWAIASVAGADDVRFRIILT